MIKSKKKKKRNNGRKMKERWIYKTGNELQYDEKKEYIRKQVKKKNVRTKLRKKKMR